MSSQERDCPGWMDDREDCGDCPYFDEDGCLADPNNAVYYDLEDVDDARARLADADRRARRGTSECDGTCNPQCAWCLAAHDCPDQCGGGDKCPYVALAAAERGAAEADDGAQQMDLFGGGGR